MTESDWTIQGGTLSHINACKEFGLSEDEIFEGMKRGKLQYRRNSAHGNPYFRLLRVEVESLALELLGANGVKELEIKHKLRTINTEINSLKRKLAALEKNKIALIEIQKQGLNANVNRKTYIENQ